MISRIAIDVRPVTPLSAARRSRSGGSRSDPAPAQREIILTKPFWGLPAWHAAFAGRRESSRPTDYVVVSLFTYLLC